MFNIHITGRMLKWGLVLAVIMLITGSINTISAKFADLQSIWGVDGCVSFNRDFYHPFFQAIQMFIGESGCLVVYYITVFVAKRKGKVPDVAGEGFKPYFLILPACCDLCGTSLLYLGLSMTYASVAQMMRGAVIIFTGLFARVLLKQKFERHNILGMFIIVVGLAYVGFSQTLKFAGDTPSPNNKEARNPTLGALLILGAQVVSASQMVVEQKFISQYEVPPLQVVGWEGIWGLTAALLLNLVFYFIPQFPPQVNTILQEFADSATVNRSDPHCTAANIKSVVNHLENPIDGAVQFVNSRGLILAGVGLIVSIAIFNWAGVSVTSYVNATFRMILGTLRTILIWGFGLIMGWESTNPKRIGFELAGFVLLLAGTFIYKDIIIAPALSKVEEWWLTRGGREVLIDADDAPSSVISPGIQSRRYDSD